MFSKFFARMARKAVARRMARATTAFEVRTTSGSVYRITPTKERTGRNKEIINRKVESVCVVRQDGERPVPRAAVVMYRARTGMFMVFDKRGDLVRKTSGAVGLAV